MTDEERDLHLVFLKMRAPHFEESERLSRSYTALQYVLTREMDWTWVLLTPDGQVLIRSSRWYLIMIQINSTLGVFDTLQKVMDIKGK